MSVVEENIRRVQQKLQDLLKRYQQLQKENLQLKNGIQELKIKGDSNQARIVELEQQVGILKSAAGKMNEADKKSFEKHINQYITQIDKCIGLLSE